MKEFEVQLYRMTHYSQYGTYVIKAKSEADAEKKINDLIYDDAISSDNYYHENVVDGNENNEETGAWDLEPEEPGDEEVTEDWEIQVISEKES